MWVGKNNLCAVGMLSATIEYNGPQAGVSFLLIKLTHFKVNTQKITLACKLFFFRNINHF